jgi:hypothetical protein
MELKSRSNCTVWQPKLATLREEILPNGTEGLELLLGNLEQLHQMSMFITEAGLSI